MNTDLTYHSKKQSITYITFKYMEFKTKNKINISYFQAQSLSDMFIKKINLSMKIQIHVFLKSQFNNILLPKIDSCCQREMFSVRFDK